MNHKAKLCVKACGTGFYTPVIKRAYFKRLVARSNFICRAARFKCSFAMITQSCDVVACNEMRRCVGLCRIVLRCTGVIG